ncbi:MAG: type 4a pilus biogenesis protein PilO [Candidatus Omnitrophica bacterium]|nr:type 4a pilus biogenesis protein PilO [Candidatus Omnitrophota bacterium]
MSLDISFLKKIKIPIFQIILGCIAGVCLFLTVPQVMNMQKVSKEIADKRAILNELDTGIKNFAFVEKEEASLSQAYNDFLAGLPAQKDFPVFLELISKLAKNNDVKIVAIEPQKITEAQGLFFINIPVFIDAYCGYHELGKFINDIESADKFMRIGNLKIRKDDPDTDKIQVFISIYAFCLSEDNSV